jgi:hypothetical protein
VSRDPIGTRGGVNIYSFTGNNSIVLIDYFGLYSTQKSFSGSFDYTSSQQDQIDATAIIEKSVKKTVADFYWDDAACLCKRIQYGVIFKKMIHERIKFNNRVTGNWAFSVTANADASVQDPAQTANTVLNGLSFAANWAGVIPGVNIGAAVAGTIFQGVQMALPSPSAIVNGITLNLSSVSISGLVVTRINEQKNWLYDGLVSSQDASVPETTYNASSEYQGSEENCDKWKTHDFSNTEVWPFSVAEGVQSGTWGVEGPIPPTNGGNN